ncbi:MAG: acyl-CoA thioesterase [Acidimicrobiales bacterium]
MQDLTSDTAVEPRGPGRYAASLSDRWEIWGPMGGYVASTALRAVGAENAAARPASFFCQYHAVAAFGPIDIEVVALRAGRTVGFHRARVTQGDRPILEATVCSVGDLGGAHALEHVDVAAPAVDGPDGLPSMEDLVPEDTRPPFRFWENFDSRPLDWQADWPPTEPLDPVWRQWLRFRPGAAFDDDPWLNACRAIVLVDIQSWPAAHRPHAWRQLPVYAPSLDLYVAFHQPPPWGDWLLTDGHSPIARGGLMAWTGRLWSSDRRLLASGGGQLICRRVPS